MKFIDKLRELLLESGVSDQQITAAFESLRKYNPVFYMTVADSEASEDFTLDTLREICKEVKLNVAVFGKDKSIELSRQAVDDHVKKQSKNN